MAAAVQSYINNTPLTLGSDWDEKKYSKYGNFSKAGILK
jgi:hypothetical protein